MTHVPFPDRASAPDDERLRAVLGDMYEPYRRLLAQTVGFAAEWKFHSPKTGWQLKVSDRKKSLVWLFPMSGAFRVGFALRDAERAALLAAGIPADLRRELEAAERYPEGWALRLVVDGPEAYEPVARVVEVLVPLRSTARSR